MKIRNAPREELFTAGEELFMGVAAMTTVTILVVLFIAAMYGVRKTHVLGTLAAGAAPLVAAAFVMHWAIGWLTMLIAALVLAGVHTGLKRGTAATVKLAVDPRDDRS